MPSRNILAVAVTVMATAAAAVVALGANLGIFGLSRESGPGQFPLVDRSAVLAPTTAVPGPAPTTAPTSPPAPGPAASGSGTPSRSGQPSTGASKPGPGPGVTSAAPAAAPTTRPSGEDHSPPSSQDD